MTLGLAPTQGDLLRSTVSYCEGRVAEDSIYAVLHRECFRLFPDVMFADLFTDVGRRSEAGSGVDPALLRGGHDGHGDFGPVREPGSAEGRRCGPGVAVAGCACPVSYTHLRAHETDSYLVCRL